MSYKLDFFDSFVCSGSACKNTCCSGWDIALDKETYDFYQASHGAFSKYVKKNIGQTDGNCYIKMTEESVCPFLNEEGLCKIYQEYGPEHMGNTCRLFPRACLNIEGRTAFSIYHFTRKDKYVFGIMIGLFTVFTGGCMRGASYATYDPRIILAGFSINGYEAPVVASKAWTILTYVSFGIFCFLPIIIDVIESVSFSHSRRKSAVNLEMTYKKIYETLEQEG